MREISKNRKGKTAYANKKSVLMVMRSGQMQEIIDPYLLDSIQRIEALYLLMLSINLFFFNQQISIVQPLCDEYCIMYNTFICPDPMELTVVSITGILKINT